MNQVNDLIFISAIQCMLLLSCSEKHNAKKVVASISPDNFDTVYLKTVDSVTLKFIESGKDTLYHHRRGYFQIFTRSVFCIHNIYFYEMVSKRGVF